jgi:hypothetical protein
MRVLRIVFSRFVLVLFGILLAVLEQQWEPDAELLLHLKPNLELEITGHPEFQ